MKLLVVSTWFPWPPDNGSKLRAFHLLRELSAAPPDHAAVVLRLERPGDDRPRAAAASSASRWTWFLGRPFTGARLTLAWTALGHAALVRAGVLPDMKAARPTRRVARDTMPPSPSRSPAALYLRSVSRPVVFDEAEVAVIEEQAHPNAGRSAGCAGASRGGSTRVSSAACAGGSTARPWCPTPNARDLVRIGCDAGALSVVPNGVDDADLEWPQDRAPCRLVYPGVADLLGEPRCRAVVSRDDPAGHSTGPAGGRVLGHGRAPSGVTAADLPNARLATLTGHLPDVRPAVAGSAVCVVPLRIGGGTRLKILPGHGARHAGRRHVEGGRGPGCDAGPGHPDWRTRPGVRLTGAQAAVGPWFCRQHGWRRTYTRASERYTWTRSGALLDEALSRAVAEWKAMNR